MYVRSQGEIADLWRWKLVRTGMVGFVDDQYIDSARDSTESAGSGKKFDPGDGYTDNETMTVENTTTPKFTCGCAEGLTDTPGLDHYVVKHERKRVLTAEELESLPDGAEIPSVVARKLTGDRGDIRAQVATAQSSGYDPETGTWTLEFARKLTTGSKYDIQFDDLKDTYYFAVSVFNNARHEHSFNKGAIAFTFAPAEQSTTTSSSTTSTTVCSGGSSGGSGATTSTTVAHHASPLWFWDVPGGAWYKPFVDVLSSRGVIAGYPNGEFRPQGAVTRAELSKMLCLTMGWQLEDVSRQSFSDVESSHWAYRYIETARAKGVLAGYPEGDFRPNRHATRAEIAAVVAKCLKLSPATCSFTDIKSCWAKNEIAACAHTGIVGGYGDDTFRPNNVATRAEIAKIVAKMLSAMIQQ